MIDRETYQEFREHTVKIMDQTIWNGYRQALTQKTGLPHFFIVDGEWQVWLPPNHRLFVAEWPNFGPEVPMSIRMLGREMNT